MEISTSAESLHRLVKEALDSGRAATVEDARRIFQGYRLALEIAPADASSGPHQLALLTGIALARRVFLGGVEVFGPMDAATVLPLPIGRTLGEAVAELGGRIAAPGTVTDLPHVTIGGDARSRTSDFHLRTVFAGWRGGVVPVDSDVELPAPHTMPLAAILAVALAVNEAFLHVRNETPAAGRRAVGLSLWRPQAEYDWLQDAVDEPELQLLPSRLWLLGLGHLGQAYLWALGSLPYREPCALELVLQDVDVITESTESTSILTHAALTGLKKTRAMAQWAERRGFSTKIHERLFGAEFRRQDDEPIVALCGLDNALGRRALDTAGFGLVVETGLGRGYRDFRTIRLHTLPASRPAAQIWRDTPKADESINGAAYQDLLKRGALDQCGVTLLAGKAVGAPFVGAVAATLAVSEILRLLHGGALTQLADLDLLNMEHRVVVPQSRDFSAFNPGYTAALCAALCA